MYFMYFDYSEFHCPSSAFDVHEDIIRNDLWLWLRLRQDICIVPCNECDTHLQIAQEWQVLTRNHTVLPSKGFHAHAYQRMEWAILPLLPSRSTSPHFDWYSFPVPQRVGGWVGLGGWLRTEVLGPPKDGHLSQY